MTDAELLSAVLRQQGFALFEYADDGALHPLGKPADWCGEVFGEAVKTGNPVQLTGELPFLEDFLEDLGHVWNSKVEGGAGSGSWIEQGPDGRELALEAWALWLGGKRIVVIQNAQRRYDETVQVLQRARDSMLEHERLQKEIQKKEILLHCIIHDLSQPLTAMRGCFSLLALTELPVELKEVVEIAERQSQKQEVMIRGILEAFSADLAAQQAIEREPQKAPDLVRCAQKTVEAFTGAFLQHGARIEVDPQLDASRDWRVMGEESRVLRIYGNLVENALRHSDPGTAVTLRVLDEDRYLRACVDDQGPGLPDDESATHLFALFAKGKGERAGKAGLGLYFCKMTVERWNGTVGCESRPGGGARFWFRLPRLL